MVDLYSSISFGKPLFHREEAGITTLEGGFGILESVRMYKQIEQAHQMRRWTNKM